MPVVNANSVDPDQTPRSVASGLGQHFLPLSHLWDARHKWVNILTGHTPKIKFTTKYWLTYAISILKCCCCFFFCCFFFFAVFFFLRNYGLLCLC